MLFKEEISPIKPRTEFSSRRSSNVQLKEECSHYQDKDDEFENISKLSGAKTFESRIEPRLSYSSASSSKKLNENTHANTEFNSLKLQIAKNKNEMKGKIDFINSLYEEFNLQPRKKTLLPSNRPISPDISPREVDYSPKNSKEKRKIKKKAKGKKDENDNDKNQLDFDDIKTVKINEKINFEYNNLEDEIGLHERQENNDVRLYSEVFEADQKLNSTRKANQKIVSTGKKLKPSKEEKTLETEQSDIEHKPFEEILGTNESFEYKINDATQRKNELAKPPLPAKRSLDTEEKSFRTTEGSCRKTVRQSSGKENQLFGIKEEKNYVEMNKNTSANVDRISKNYEKVLKNIDQTCGPLLESLRQLSSQSSFDLSISKLSSAKSKMWSPVSIRSPMKQQSTIKKCPSMASSPSVTSFVPCETSYEISENKVNAIKSFYEGKV